MEMAHKMGITQQRLFPHLTLSIGDIEATPLEMATVMATIANGGVHQTPYFVQKVDGPDGKVLIDESAPAPATEVLDQDVAECEQLMLRGVITGGTGTATPTSPATSRSARPAPPTTGATRGSSAPPDASSSPPRCGSATAPTRSRRRLRWRHRGADLARLHEPGALGRPTTSLPDPGPVCSRPGADREPRRRATAPGLPADTSQLPTVSQTPPPCRRPPPRRHPTAEHHRPPPPPPPATTTPPATTVPGG